MVDAGARVGTEAPMVSRTKCFHIYRGAGGKTNCARPIGHDGPHVNVRGETELGEHIDLTKIDALHMKEDFTKKASK